jgi:hypothetical protein
MTFRAARPCNEQSNGRPAATVDLAGAVDTEFSAGDSANARVTTKRLVWLVAKMLRQLGLERGFNDLLRHTGGQSAGSHEIQAFRSRSFDELLRELLQIQR